MADTFSQLGEKADCISRVYRETSGKPAALRCCWPPGADAPLQSVPRPSTLMLAKSDTAPLPPR